MKTYPKILHAEAMDSKKIKVIFHNGAVRIYDCRPLLEKEPFIALKDEALFRSVRADKNGYGVVWNDEIDLAESEIWIHGHRSICVSHGNAGRGRRKMRRLQHR
jgi:hypothetical protein